MKLRDLLILISLVLLILALTVAEKYADRQRESRQLKHLVDEQLRWRRDAVRAFETRWDDLSVELRGTLDSMARTVLSTGVSPESLAVVVMDQPATPLPSKPVTKTKQEAAPKVPPVARPDSLAAQVADAYETALGVLPADLNAYERRVATSEIASLLRARFGVTQVQFNSLLKAASR